MSGKLFINGEWMLGGGDEFESTNPGTSEIIWRGREASAIDVNQVIAAANNALPIWSELALSKRIETLEKYHQIMKKEEDSLALALSEEMGKPRWEAKTEIQSALRKLPITIDAYHERCKTQEQTTATEKQWVWHKPHGVLAVFGPFNFPIHLPNGHIVPALLAGNTVILKPSEQTPRIAEKMIQCFERAGFPRGVINLVQGGGRVGQMLSQHPALNGVLFTGSFDVGQQLAQHFAKHPGKILVLELGGNNPLIVHRISDLAAAEYYTIQSAFLTSGQRCTCTRRLIITRDSNTMPFIEGLINKIKRIRVGLHTDNPEPFMGPVISIKAAQKIESAYNDLLSKGAKPLVPLQNIEPIKALLRPVLLDVTDIERKDDEIFGPLLQLIIVNNLEEAIKEANNTAFGLAAGILTDSESDYQQFARTIQAGAINWNRPTTGSSSRLPFGGIGKSGNFRPTAYYAPDYAAYPMACMEYQKLSLPDQLTPGIEL